MLQPGPTASALPSGPYPTALTQQPAWRAPRAPHPPCRASCALTPWFKMLTHYAAWLAWLGSAITGGGARYCYWRRGRAFPWFGGSVIGAFKLRFVPERGPTSRTLKPKFAHLLMAHAHGCAAGPLLSLKRPGATPSCDHGCEWWVAQRRGWRRPPVAGRKACLEMLVAGLYRPLWWAVSGSGWCRQV